MSRCGRKGQTIKHTKAELYLCLKTEIFKNGYFHTIFLSFKIIIFIIKNEKINFCGMYQPIYNGFNLAIMIQKSCFLNHEVLEPYSIFSNSWARLGNLLVNAIEVKGPFKTQEKKREHIKRYHISKITYSS